MNRTRPSSSDSLRLGALLSACTSMAVWIRAKTLDQRERGASERQALLVGLAAPTLWLGADACERRARRTRR